jgi:glycosyltransferase involved in cell wall biosynthesis
MTIFNFVEGVWPRKGGVGIGCVPQIGMSLARQGVHVVLVSGDPPTPGYESFVQPDVAAALRQEFGRATFAIVSHPAWGKYTFAPSVFWRVGPAVAKADVLALHSLYSFPVLAAYVLARLYRKPYVLWPHGVLSSFQRGVSRRKKWIYDRLIGRRILKGASAVICTGEGERDDVLSLNFTKRSVVIPHGIDLSDYASLPERGRFRARYFPGHQGPLIIYLGRLAVIKNLELLIEAMARLLPAIPEARLAIIGPADPPPFARTVSAWVKRHGIESQTVLTGPITNLRLKQEALVDADLFVMPSHAENFCHALFEAMAASLPAVVSDYAWG